MEIIFHSHANKTHFHKKGCAPTLILKERVFGTRKWPITVVSPESRFTQRRSLGLKSILVLPMTYDTLQHGEPTSPRCYFS